MEFSHVLMSQEHRVDYFPAHPLAKWDLDWRVLDSDWYLQTLDCTASWDSDGACSSLAGRQRQDVGDAELELLYSALIEENINDNVRLPEKLSANTNTDHRLEISIETLTLHYRYIDGIIT